MKTATKDPDRKPGASPRAARPALYPIPRPGRRQQWMLFVTAALLGLWLIALAWLAWRSH